MLFLFLASMVGGLWQLRWWAARCATSGCGILYHLTAIAAVICYTLVGLALARSRLRLAVMAYEVKPGGMMIGLLVFAPFVIGMVTAFTIGFGGIVGLLVVALIAARLDVTPGVPAAPESIRKRPSRVRGACGRASTLRFGRNGFTRDSSKSKALGEILAAVRILFSEHLLLDEVEHHVAHILAFPHAPLGHQRGRHRAELFEREIPVALQQLRPADVARLAAVALGDALEREIQRVLEEKVSVRIKALVAFQDGNDGLFELHRLHGNQDAGRPRGMSKRLVKPHPDPD